MPCARGSVHRETARAAAVAAGKARPTFPYLEDDAAGVRLFESADIVQHLLDTYGNGAPLPPPSDYFLPSTLVTGWMPTLLRGGRGGAVEQARRTGRPPPAQPLTLYWYEGNQFCRLVREVLTELDLPHVLSSVAKRSPRRAELAARAGRSTAPYLVDPNTGVEMFESADIVAYLYRTYA
uniref:GST N-terminal domain-containing protein n=1 Tax=Eutreptiella gymnastica TaxID=73025 RepID=A0A6T2D2K5_9EUGL